MNVSGEIRVNFLIWTFRDGSADVTGRVLVISDSVIIVSFRLFYLSSLHLRPIDQWWWESAGVNSVMLGKFNFANPRFFVRKNYNAY